MSAPPNWTRETALSFSNSLIVTCLRLYADAERILDRAIAVDPKDSNTRAFRAATELRWHADSLPLISTIETFISQDSSEAKHLAFVWIRGGLCKRDFEGTRRVLAALPIDGCYDGTIPIPRFWCETVVAQLRGDSTAARTAFINPPAEGARLVAEQPAYAEGFCVLGMADAAVGNKEEAIREGRRAIELMPISKSAIEGPLLIQYLALIYACVDRRQGSCPRTAKCRGTRTRSFELRSVAHPYWDPLRGDPGFEKIVASLAPK